MPINTEAPLDGLGAEVSAFTAPVTAQIVFAVGDYLVGDADDEYLSGHPDIRY